MPIDTKTRVEASRETGPTGIARRFQEVATKTPKTAPAKVLAAAERKARPLGKPKSGRPKKSAKDEPWKAAGVSRSAWYRKNKE